MYKELIASGLNQPPEYTARILTYEIGDIHKIMIYTDRHGRAGYVGEMKIALADSSAMLKLLTEQLGFEITEIEALGFERFGECQENLAKGHR